MSEHRPLEFAALDDGPAYGTEHPHEPAIPPALDPEGRCLICGMEVRIEALEAENANLRAAMERIATGGGWVTTWRVDEAEPESAEQPTLSNEAQNIARAALAAATPAAEEEA